MDGMSFVGNVAGIAAIPVAIGGILIAIGVLGARRGEAGVRSRGSRWCTRTGFVIAIGGVVVALVLMIALSSWDYQM